MLNTFLIFDRCIDSDDKNIYKKSILLYIIYEIAVVPTTGRESLLGEDITRTLVALDKRGSTLHDIASSVSYIILFAILSVCQAFKTV